MPTALRPTHDRLARRAILTIAVALFLAAPQLCAGATRIAPEATIARAGPPPPLPPQGLYEGCAPRSAGDACAAHLVEIRAAGFRYVLNYSSWYGSPEEVLRYADAAAALGLQLIWPLNHPAWRGVGSLAATYPDFVGDHPRRSDPEVLPLAISLIASHPATWGFYIGDEVPAAEAGQVATLSTAVRHLAPDKPQLYVARPGAALLEPFAPFADLAGVDTYPIGSGDPPVRQAARTARTVAAEAGAQTTVVLQAFSWSQYRPADPPHYPDAQSLRSMRDAAVRHANPSLILWYSYQDILRSDHPRQHWCELRWAAFAPVAPDLDRREAPLCRSAN